MSSVAPAGASFSGDFPQERSLQGTAVVRFGPYEVDLGRTLLQRSGYRIRLQPKSFLVLRALLESPGEVVTREELRARLWPENTFVEFESSLNVAVRRLRDALGDTAQAPEYIETIPRQGYRFIGALAPAVASAAEPHLLPIGTPADAASQLATDLLAWRPPGSVQTATARSRWWLLLPAVAALLAALSVSIFQWRRASVAASPSLAPSIAVLPFADMSPEKNQQYFSDGLAEELLNDLARTPGLHVAARTSSFQFRDQGADLPAIGQKLGVATILEGSVRKEGNRVRISVELVKAENGFQLWSGTYDRDLNHIFAVQDDIARAITGELRVRLLHPPAPELTQQSTNPAAYNAYLQGRFYYERRTRDDLDKALAYFQQAVQLDPNYAQAWSALAWVWIARAEAADGASFEEGYRMARAAAEKALQLDPNLAEALAGMGRIKRTFDWDWTGADSSFQKALALEPQNSAVLFGASTLAASLGRFDQAITLNRRAVAVDPLSVTAHLSLGMHAYYAGRLKLAIDALRKALAISPENPEAHYMLGLVHLAESQPQQALAEFEKDRVGSERTVGQALAYTALGKQKDANAALQQLLTRYHEQAAYQVAEVYAFRGDADHAFHWLEIVRTNKDAGLAAIKGDPLLKDLYHDPRYSLLLEKIGLPVGS